MDLSKATDRFPIVLISMVLRGNFSSKFVSAWEDLMVGYPFLVKGKEVRYATGNPMGALSSWATFALAHHFVVFCACK